MSRRKFNLSWKQALAEILLIFVGITLAVTFQNWNDNNKDETLQKGYYERLLAELKQDVKDIDGISNYHEYRLNSITDFFEFLDNNPKPVADSLQKIVNQVSYHMSNYVPNENTHQELISTGNIKLIQTDVRELLLRLSQMHTYVAETQKEFHARYQNRRDQMAEIIDEASFYEIRKNPNSSLVRWQRDINSEGFQRYTNLLAVRLNIADTLLDMFNTLKGQCEELIRLIEEELT